MPLTSFKRNINFGDMESNTMLLLLQLQKRFEFMLSFGPDFFLHILKKTVIL